MYLGISKLNKALRLIIIPIYFWTHYKYVHLEKKKIGISMSSYHWTLLKIIIFYAPFVLQLPVIPEMSIIYKATLLFHMDRPVYFSLLRKLNLPSFWKGNISFIFVDQLNYLHHVLSNFLSSPHNMVECFSCRTIIAFVMLLALSATACKILFSTLQA